MNKVLLHLRESAVMPLELDNLPALSTALMDSMREGDLPFNLEATGRLIQKIYSTCSLAEVVEWEGWEVSRSLRPQYANADPRPGSPFANLHRHRQQQQQRRRQASPNQGNSSPFGVSPILLYAGLILLSTILSGLFFGGDQYNAASTFNTKTAGSYWGSDVFQFQYSRQYRELKQTSRSKVSYYVDPGVYQSFLNTEMPRYKHVPRLAPAPEESKGVPKTRIKLLEQWVDRTWFAVVSDMCSQEERNRATRISQSQWFFGTKEGNEERKKTAEAEVLPYCTAKSIWQKSGKCPAIEKQGYY